MLTARINARQQTTMLLPSASDKNKNEMTELPFALNKHISKSSTILNSSGCDSAKLTYWYVCHF